MDVTKNNLLILDAIFADSSTSEEDFADYASDNINITTVDRETITSNFGTRLMWKMKNMTNLFTFSPLDRTNKNNTNTHSEEKLKLLMKAKINDEPSNNREDEIHEINCVNNRHKRRTRENKVSNVKMRQQDEKITKNSNYMPGSKNANTKKNTKISKTKRTNGKTSTHVVPSQVHQHKNRKPASNTTNLELDDIMGLAKVKSEGKNKIGGSKNSQALKNNKIQNTTTPQSEANTHSTVGIDHCKLESHVLREVLRDSDHISSSSDADGSHVSKRKKSGKKRRGGAQKSDNKKELSHQESNETVLTYNVNQDFRGSDDINVRKKILSEELKSGYERIRNAKLSKNYSDVSSPNSKVNNTLQFITPNDVLFDKYPSKNQAPHSLSTTQLIGLCVTFFTCFGYGIGIYSDSWEIEESIYPRYANSLPANACYKLADNDKAFVGSATNSKKSRKTRETDEVKEQIQQNIIKKLGKLAKHRIRIPKKRGEKPPEENTKFSRSSNIFQNPLLQSQTISKLQGTKGLWTECAFIYPYGVRNNSWICNWSFNNDLVSETKDNLVRLLVLTGFVFQVLSCYFGTRGFIYDEHLIDKLDEIEVRGKNRGPKNDDEIAPKQSLEAKQHKTNQLMEFEQRRRDLMILLCGSALSISTICLLIAMIRYWRVNLDNSDNPDNANSEIDPENGIPFYSVNPKRTDYIANSMTKKDRRNCAALGDSMYLFISVICFSIISAYFIFCGGVETKEMKQYNLNIEKRYYKKEWEKLQKRKQRQNELNESLMVPEIKSEYKRRISNAKDQFPHPEGRGSRSRLGTNRTRTTLGSSGSEKSQKKSQDHPEDKISSVSKVHHFTDKQGLTHHHYRHRSNSIDNDNSDAESHESCRITNPLLYNKYAKGAKENFKKRYAKNMDKNIDRINKVNSSHPVSQPVKNSWGPVIEKVQKINSVTKRPTDLTRSKTDFNFHTRHAQRQKQQNIFRPGLHNTYGSNEYFLAMKNHLNLEAMENKNTFNQNKQIPTLSAITTEINLPAPASSLDNLTSVTPSVKFSKAPVIEIHDYSSPVKKKEKKGISQKLADQNLTFSASTGTLTQSYPRSISLHFGDLNSSNSINYTQTISNEQNSNDQGYIGDSMTHNTNSLTVSNLSENRQISSYGDISIIQSPSDIDLHLRSMQFRHQNMYSNQKILRSDTGHNFILVRANNNINNQPSNSSQTITNSDLKTKMTYSGNSLRTNEISRNRLSIASVQSGISDWYGSQASLIQEQMMMVNNEGDTKQIQQLQEALLRDQLVNELNDI